MTENKIRVQEKESEPQTVRLRPDPSISTTDVPLSEKAKKLMAAAVPPSVRESSGSQQASQD
jgi:hypothetical protein